MNIIRNILAIIGLLAVIGAGIAYPKVSEIQARFAEFDEGAWDTYMEMFELVLETGNSAEAMVWKVKVSEDIAFEELEETLRFVANEHNFMNVGELPFYKQIEAMTGQPYRKVKFYMFCDAMIGANMIEHSDAYSAFMPCRLSVVEDKEGNLWIYTMNMDPMIHGGTPLPPDLKEEAIRVKKIMLDVMDRAAKGDF